ncbi:MAG: (2Fe-2S)-binding protein [Caldilineae bacterium]|nr:MAG: (2Fe-2S)-binding protein [Caldilineae bacterium]
MKPKIVSFTLNGRPVDVMVRPMTTLQNVLRRQLELTATKAGCRQGSCGSCTVLVNGEPMAACLLPIEDVEGQEVLTLEGITPLHGLHPIQEAFFENFAVQCGYCTPGMIMVTKALLEREPRPDEATIREALSGNLCRCTGYQAIVQAVTDAADRLHGNGGVS